MTPVVVALVVVLAAIVLMLSLSGKGQVPWSNKLRRVNAGVARKAEWMAPDDVIQQVGSDYLAAIRWLQESAMLSWSQQSAGAAVYLTGDALQRQQKLLAQYRRSRAPYCLGVLRCDHQIEVRLFSEEGERCLVVDCQSQRRMATYDHQSQRRLHTQDLGDGAVVYQMLYDNNTKRWKIEKFIQELPLGWTHHKTSRRIQLLSVLPTVVGRDN